MPKLKTPCTVGSICKALETLAPAHLAEEWDNVGLLVGDAAKPVRKLMLTIDLTGRVLVEAARGRCEMVMAYHPIIFKPIGRCTAQATPIAYAAVRRDIAVYSMHTALDAAPGGTNDVLASAIGILNPQPLEPKPDEAQCKVVVFTPPSDLLAVSKAAFDAGAGRIGNYGECSFYTRGEGTFRGAPGSNPSVGKPGQLEHAQELRLELVAPKAKLRDVIKAIRKSHSYETPAIDVYPTEQLYGGLGTGRIGLLAKAMNLQTLIAHVKSVLGVPHVLSVGQRRRRLRRAACCAGSCGRIIGSALAQRADVYITGELRHHDAVDAAEKGLAVICVGHSNSERLTLRSLATRLRGMLPGLTVTLALNDRDPFEIL